MIFDGNQGPMFLPGVENNPDAEGPYADLIRAVKESGSPVSQIWHLFAFNPEATKHLERFTQAIMRGPGPLSPGMRELIAAYTSVRNQCPFWTNAHAAVAAELLGDEKLVRGVLDDPATSGLSGGEKLLFAFIDKVNHHSPHIGSADIEPLHKAGWTDAALYQAITVCALFNFYNRWIDASGVHPLAPEVHKGHAKRMAKTGYVRTPEE